MKIQTQRFTCGNRKCNNVWDRDIICDCPMEEFAAFLKIIRCPVCGGSKLFLGGDKMPIDFAAIPTANREDYWLSHGERGLSSNTIFSVISGRNVMPSGWSIGQRPSDPADFFRCRKLLKLMPEWRDRLDEVSSRFPAWTPLVEHWAEMDSLFEEEAATKTGKAPRLYALMQQLYLEGDEIVRLAAAAK